MSWDRSVTGVLRHHTFKAVQCVPGTVKSELRQQPSEPDCQPGTSTCAVGAPKQLF